MSIPYSVHETHRAEDLPEEWLYEGDREAFIFVHFEHIVEALAQGFEDHAVAIIVVEGVYESYDAFLVLRVLAVNVSYDRPFGLRTLYVALDSFNYLPQFIFVPWLRISGYRTLPTLLVRKSHRLKVLSPDIYVPGIHLSWICSEGILGSMKMTCQNNYCYTTICWNMTSTCIGICFVRSCDP